MFGDERWKKRAGSGSAEGAAEADSDEHGVDGPDSSGLEHAGSDGEPEKDCCADGLQGIAGEDDAATIIAVGGVAGGEHADEAGEEEGEAGEAKLKGGVGDLVNLPGDGDRLRLGSYDDHEARGLVQTEVARTEGVARTNGRSTVGVCHVFMVAYFTARGSVEVCALESDPWHNLSVTPLAISRGLFVILLFVYAVSFF